MEIAPQFQTISSGKVILITKTKINGDKETTVVPTKSYIDVMFCLQSYQDIESIDHMCIIINTIRRKGLIHMWSIDSVSSSGVYKSMFYLTIVNKILRHCHPWLARQ